MAVRAGEFYLISEMIQPLAGLFDLHRILGRLSSLLDTRAEFRTRSPLLDGAALAAMTPSRLLELVADEFRAVIDT